jgi:glycosyltransferase involved in cell wall biosynthesis
VDFLCRVIEALKVQTLAKEDWELLLIDNASLVPLDRNWDLTWHPNARHVRENDLGLTPARLRGIREAQGALLIFVDDDNVLAPNYLEQALQIARSWPILGAWGGDVAGEFETPPALWTREYLGYVGVRECTDTRWSNGLDDWGAFPHGAGLCVRAEVARVYDQLQEGNPQRKLLDRKGGSLMSGGDVDLVLCSRELGLGFGRFPELQVTHLIPDGRMSEDYLLKLVRAAGCSNALLDHIHRRPPQKIHRRGPAFFWSLLHLFRHGRRSYRFHQAYVRGMYKGVRISRSMNIPTRKSP